MCLKSVFGPFISRWLPTKDINHICWGSLENLLRCLESKLPDANEVKVNLTPKESSGFSCFLVVWMCLLVGVASFRFNIFSAVKKGGSGTEDEDSTASGERLVGALGVGL